MKKVFLIFIIIFCLTIIPSCKKKEFSYSSLNQVTYETLLSQDARQYIVIAWQVDCSNCEKLKDTVEEYYKYAKKNKKEAYPIFGLNVNLQENKDMVLPESDSPYPVGMIGATDYTKIKVKTTPTILIIKNGRLLEDISDYSTYYPVTEGKQYLTNLMNGDN